MSAQPSEKTIVIKKENQCITSSGHRDLHTRISAREEANNIIKSGCFKNELNPYFVTGFVDAIGEESFSILFTRSKNSKFG